MHPVIKWMALEMLAAVLVAGGAVYLLVNWTPADYKPAVLTEQEKIEVRQAMNRKFALLFGRAQISADALMGMEGVEGIRTSEEIIVDEATGRITRITRTEFKTSMSCEELNKWISAMPQETMDRLIASGVTAPAIALNDGRITFYARLDKYDKVVGLDVGFDFDDRGAATIKMGSSSVGRLPIPDRATEYYKAAAIEKAKSDIEGVSRTAERMVGGEMGKTASTVVRSLGPKLGAALGGEPVKLSIGQAADTVQIRSIKSVEGRMTLDMVAVQHESLDGQTDKAFAAAHPVAGHQPHVMSPSD